jgi:hypothetical protein
VFVGKPEVRRPFGRPRPKWESKRIFKRLYKRKLVGLVFLRTGISDEKL